MMKIIIIRAERQEKILPIFAIILTFSELQLKRVGILIKKSYSVVEVDPRSSSANTKSSISDSKDFVVFGVVSVEGQNISSEAS